MSSDRHGRTSRVVLLDNTRPNLLLSHAHCALTTPLQSLHVAVLLREHSLRVPRYRHSRYAVGHAGTP